MVHCLRDPTRGGLATTLNELAQRSRVGIEMDESRHSGSGGGARRL